MSSLLLFKRGTPVSKVRGPGAMLSSSTSHLFSDYPTDTRVAGPEAETSQLSLAWAVLGAA